MKFCTFVVIDHLVEVLKMDIWSSEHQNTWREPAEHNARRDPTLHLVEKHDVSSRICVRQYPRAVFWSCLSDC